MTSKPVIFISVVRKELKRARKLLGQRYGFARRIRQCFVVVFGLLVIIAGGIVVTTPSRCNAELQLQQLPQQNEQLLQAQADIRQMLKTSFRVYWGELQETYEYLLCSVARKRGVSSEQLRSFLNHCVSQAMADDAVPLKHKVRALREAGRLVQARDFAIENAHRLERDHRKSRREEVELWTEAAKSDFDLHQFTEALDHAIKATSLVDCQKDFPTWSTARLQTALAMDWLSRGKEALALYKVLIPLQQAGLGPEHPETVNARYHRGIILFRADRLGEAEREYRAVLAIRERTLGAKHPETLQVRRSIASILDERHKDREAEQEHRAVVKTQERVLGAEHPDTFSSRYCWAHWLFARHKYGEAEQEFREVLKIRQRVMGAEDRFLFDTCSNLALCLERQGKMQEALDFTLRAEMGLQKIPGLSRDDLFMFKLARERIEEKMKKKQ